MNESITHSLLYSGTKIYQIQTTDTSYGGETIVLPQPFNGLVIASNAALSDSDREFLDRFLQQGLKLQLSQTLLLQTYGRTVPIRLLSEQYQAKQVLLFGEDTWQCVPHLHFEKNTSFTLFNIKAFTALPIATIENNPAEKKAFWGELKPLFTT